MTKEKLKEALEKLNRSELIDLLLKVLPEDTDPALLEKKPEEPEKITERALEEIEGWQGYDFDVDWEEYRPSRDHHDESDVYWEIFEPFKDDVEETFETALKKLLELKAFDQIKKLIEGSLRLLWHMDTGEGYAEDWMGTIYEDMQYAVEKNDHSLDPAQRKELMDLFEKEY